MGEHVVYYSPMWRANYSPMWRAIICSVLVVLAGCAFDPGGIERGTPTHSPAGIEAAAPYATATPQTGRPVHPDNPWGERTLTVAVETPANDSREYEPLVAEALAFWENESEPYAGYPIAYDLDRNATDPDLVIAFVDEIEQCDNVSDAAGCAPYVTSPATIDRPERVEILRGYTNNSTLTVLKHELGHTLGLDHEDDPEWLMTHRSTLVRLSEPNATEREWAWADANLSVYLDASNASDEERETIREQVDRALAFYDDGADGTVPANVSFTYTDDRASADVVVTVAEDLPCTEGSGSCGSRHGVDTDEDDALERFDRLTIRLYGVTPEAVGWHVGYWLGFGMGFEDETEWPDAFRNATAADRRGEWWR